MSSQYLRRYTYGTPFSQKSAVRLQLLFFDARTRRPVILFIYK